MKNFKLLFLSVLMIILACICFSGCNKYSSEGIVFEANEDNTASSVIGYEGNKKNIIVPAEYNGLPVTELGKHAFGKCETVEKIHLPATIEHIGVYALLECPKLSYIKFDGTIQQWNDLKHANALRQLETVDVECSDGKIPKVTVSSDLKPWDQRKKYDVFFWNEGQPLYDNGGKRIIYSIANENIYNRPKKAESETQSSSKNETRVYPESLTVTICGKEYTFDHTNEDNKYENTGIDATLYYYYDNDYSIRINSNTVKITDEINENSAPDYAKALIKEIFDYDVTENKDLSLSVKPNKYGGDLFGVDYHLKKEGYSLIPWFISVEIQGDGYLEYVSGPSLNRLNRGYSDLEDFDGETVAKKLDEAITRICNIDGYTLQDYEVFDDNIYHVPDGEGDGYYLIYTVSPRFLKESTGEIAVYTSFTLLVAL